MIQIRIYVLFLLIQHQKILFLNHHEMALDHHGLEPKIFGIYLLQQIYLMLIYIMKLKVKKQMSGIKNLPKRYMTK